MTSIRAARTLVESAVLVPVFRAPDGRVRLVLVVRAPHGLHGGQLGLPGGRREAEDADLLATALREAQEEIGLSPADVEVLAPLPVVDTLSTGFRIAPFLARLSAPPTTWQRQEDEIAAVLEVPVDELRRPEAHGTELRQLPGWPEPRPVPFYRVGSHKLWGATYRIVHPLLPRLQAGDWGV